MLFFAKCIIILPELHKVLFNNCFHYFTWNRSQWNWTIVCRVCTVIFLEYRSYVGCPPLIESLFYTTVGKSMIVVLLIQLHIPLRTMDEDCQDWFVYTFQSFWLKYFAGTYAKLYSFHGSLSESFWIILYLVFIFRSWVGHEGSPVLPVSVWSLSPFHWLFVLSSGRPNSLAVSWSVYCPSYLYSNYTSPVNFLHLVPQATGSIQVQRGHSLLTEVHM